MVPGHILDNQPSPYSAPSAPPVAAQPPSPVAKITDLLPMPRRDLGHYADDPNVMRFFGDKGVGYHLPVAALAHDQVWNDTWPQPNVGPLDVDNAGTAGPLETYEMRWLYRELYRREPSIRAAVKGKADAVACLDVSVIPQDPHNDADCEAAEFVKWTVENTLNGFDGLINQLVTHALIDGWTAFEKVLLPVSPERNRKYAGLWGLYHCRALDTMWVRLQLDQFRNVLNVVNTVRGLEYYNVDKFLLFSYSSLFNNPFGQSDLRACVRSCGLIQDAYQLWYLALKMFGLPYLHGKVGAGTQRKAMEAALQELRAGGYAVTDVKDEIELLSLASATSFSAFEANIRAMREDNFMAIRGAYLPFMEGVGGTDAHGNTSISKVASDTNVDLLAKSVARVLTHQLVPWLVRDNFPAGTGYPTITLGGVSWGEVSESLNVLLPMVKDMRLPVSKDQIYKRLNWAPPDGDDDALDMNQVEAQQQLIQGQVQLQLQQQQMAAQAQMQQQMGAAQGQQQAPAQGQDQSQFEMTPPQQDQGGGEFEMSQPQQMSAEVQRFSDKAEKHKYACVYALLGEKVRERIANLHRQIDPTDLADKGLEKESHVTVRYGLHGDDSELDPALNELAHTGPFEVRFNGPSFFSGAESGKDYDVIKLDLIDGYDEELKALHGRLGDLNHTDTFKDYHPHLTVAYVKKGKGKHYCDRFHQPRTTLKDTVTELVYSDREKKKRTIKLRAPKERTFSTPAQAPQRGLRDVRVYLPADHAKPITPYQESAYQALRDAVGADASVRMHDNDGHVIVTWHDLPGSMTDRFERHTAEAGHGTDVTNTTEPGHCDAAAWLHPKSFEERAQDWRDSGAGDIDWRPSESVPEDHMMSEEPEPTYSFRKIAPDSGWERLHEDGEEGKYNPVAIHHVVHNPHSGRHPYASFEHVIERGKDGVIRWCNYPNHCVSGTSPEDVAEAQRENEPFNEGEVLHNPDPSGHISSPLAGQPLSKGWLWRFGLPGGEAPQAPEQDWRPNHSLPEDHLFSAEVESVLDELIAELMGAE